MRRRRTPVLVVSLAVLALAGCGSTAPEMPLPEVPRGVVTDLSDGLTELFTLELEQLTGSAPTSCDTRDSCTLEVHADSPEGVLLVSAWHEDSASYVLAGVAGETGEELWSIESETPTQVVHSSRHGNVLLGRSAASDEGGVEELLVVDPDSGDTVREIEVEAGTAATAVDTDHGVAVALTPAAPQSPDGSQDGEIEVLGLGADGQEHWRTKVDTEEPPSRGIILARYQEKIEVSQFGQTFEVFPLALLDPATGKASPIPEDHTDYPDRITLRTDDLSAGQIEIRRTDAGSDEITAEGGEPWSPAQDAVREGESSPRAVCGGTMIWTGSSNEPASADGSEDDALKVVALDATTGEEQWSTPMQVDNSVLCTGEGILVHDRTTVYLLDLGTGETVAEHELAPGAIPIPEGGHGYEVPESLAITPASPYSEGSPVVASIHEEGSPPRITVYG